jgi:HEAT repeat protein
MLATFALMLSLLIACDEAPAQARAGARELMTQLSAGDPEARAKAACGLRELGDEAAVAIEPLVAMLADGAPVVQSVCERNWGRWNNEHTTTPGHQAASALVAIGSRALKPLLGAVTHPSWVARRNAAWALGALDDPIAAPALVKALGDGESPVREQAAWALGAIDERSAVEPLMRVLKDSDPGVREQAAWALGAIGDSRAVDALLPALKDAHPRVRRQAAWAIGVLSR